MDYEQAKQLRADLEHWTLSLRDAPHELRVLKERTVVLCRLDTAQIRALPDDTISLLGTLKDHADDLLDELRDYR